MSCNTLLLGGSVELWSKSVNYNSSGQPESSWTYEETLDCDFMPARAEERLVGRVQNPIAYNIILHPTDVIEVSKQLRNLKDASGNLVEEGPFNIVGVRKHSGFRSISHITVNAQKVLD